MWDILYAIDASTSMGEDYKPGSGPSFVKIEAVKQGIIQTVGSAKLPFGTRVGVMGFRAPTKAMGMMVDSSQEMVQEALPLTPVTDLSVNQALLRDSLDSLKVGGATPTGEGLRRAVDMLYATPDERSKRIKKVVMVTDAKSNVGPKPEQVLDAKLARRAMVDIIAIGTAVDTKAFQDFASRTGGKLTFVNDAAGIMAALDPRIPYAESPGPDPLLDEAGRVAAVLRATDKSAASYKGILAAAGAVRMKLEQKIQDVVSLEGQTRGDVDLVVSAATNDPKWPVMSMREYSDRVWSRAADLAKLEALEASYRRAVKSLPA
ncbi:MAG: VWA domain-containing protein [Thaumarchaeota archaeon]|nr:VWA domain-containing protein [Nitrososphaerota archaeon]